ncbi:C-C motif chemokine 19-like [Brienomyrus brachyistius]|uniref:C-C motif chemokine 19-like n=1 Tax=Brienomyrus brachyistius TaxID=42636 RepID=UPI0020B455B6|nr:C-C motif chemokine 19-like [Brienomyrus brachyistius]
MSYHSTAKTSRFIPAIFLWICVFFSFCMVTQADLANDCCLSVGKKEIAFSFLTGYEIQDKGKGCAIDAVVLITRRGFKLCVPATEEWVKKLTAKIDKETKRCKSNTLQDRICKRLRAPGLPKRQ